MALAFIYVFSSSEICRYCIQCPDCGHNRPQCNSSIVGIRIRNFWQPDLYWICEKPTGEGEARRCGNNLFYQEEMGKCVFRFDYKWSCPCNECGCKKPPVEDGKCNPGRSGSPDCNDETNIGKDFTNFWDPTTYWSCKAKGSDVAISRCPAGKLFDNNSRKCIPDSEWKYTNPCPKK